MMRLRGTLEHRQVAIYFAAIGAGVAAALTVPGTVALDGGIEPALALMLFATFLQVPLPELGRAFTRLRFLAALLVSNFVVVPLLVAGLMPFLPGTPLLRLGVLMVLLTPCIDYVVTFSRIGRADAGALLASTPMLLIVQMALLPVYLRLFLGEEAAGFVGAGPFVHAFVWLIAIPLALAGVVQRWLPIGDEPDASPTARTSGGRRAAAGLNLLPVPATALVLFVVVASVLPQLGAALGEALRVVPVYVAFAVSAPLLGWGVGRVFGLDAPTGRALAFSTATRNSLVVLPLALAVPGAVPLLPTVIVTQTLVELLGALVSMRLVPRLGRTEPDAED